MFTDIDLIVSSISSSDVNSKKWRETMKWNPVKVEWDTQSGPIEQLAVENIQNRYTQVFALRGGSVVMTLDDLTVMVNKDHHALFFTVGHAVYIVTKNKKAIYVHDRTTGHFVRKMENAVIDRVGRTSTRRHTSGSAIEITSILCVPETNCLWIGTSDGEIKIIPDKLHLSAQEICGVRIKQFNSSVSNLKGFKPKTSELGSSVLAIGYGKIPTMDQLYDASFPGNSTDKSQYAILLDAEISPEKH
ncbi:unnamed protein product [Oikopleura dioica]|nr:unnamed protein product [Oikopleura dioica]